MAVVMGALAGGVLVQATGYSALKAAGAIVEGSFGGTYPISQTLAAAIPLATIALGTAVAFRVQLWNIGGEGQFYMGAFGATGIELIGGPAGWPAIVLLPAMLIAGFVAGAAWAAVPAWLRAWHGVNEIITTLMLNYVAGQLLTYLIFDSASPWRDISTIQARSFPQAIPLQPSQFWPTRMPYGIVVPFGFVLAAGAAVVLYVLLRATRFGFEMNVIGDSQRAARYSGMRTRRKILAVMALSGAIAGVGGASQDGDFRHTLDPRGLTAAGYGYAGIVIAALARYNPYVVVLVAFLLGGLQNAGYTLQGADFPSGLVGVMQGIFLFSVLGGELLVRYRIRITRSSRAAAVEVAR